MSVDVAPPPASARHGGGGWGPFGPREYHPEAWPEHINVRDERVEAFRSLMWPGSYVLHTELRATTVGTFAAPPATCEEMYSPEVFGRSCSLTIIVE